MNYKPTKFHKKFHNLPPFMCHKFIGKENKKGKLIRAFNLGVSSHLCLAPSLSNIA